MKNGKAVKGVVESQQVASSVLSEKTVTVDRLGAVLSDNDGVRRVVQGWTTIGGDSLDVENVVRWGGQADSEGESGRGVDSAAMTKLGEKEIETKT